MTEQFNYIVTLIPAKSHFLKRSGFRAEVTYNHFTHVMEADWRWVKTRQAAIELAEKYIARHKKQRGLKDLKEIITYSG